MIHSNRQTLLNQKKNLCKFIIASLSLLTTQISYAETPYSLLTKKTNTPPIIDGIGNDKAWKNS